MKKTITIKPEHFDAAVKQDWSVHTCLNSQAADGAGFLATSQGASGTELALKSQVAAKLQNIFDLNFEHPGDETKPELVALRASLPISVEVEV